VGPDDGYLYILTYQGALYRIVSSHAKWDLATHRQILHLAIGNSDPFNT
jgi:hypothetical protein